MIVAPRLNTNSEGKLISISLDYTLPNGVPIEPASILTNVMVQLVATDQKIIYESGNNILTYKTGFSIAKLATPAEISNLMVVSIGYDDLLGNTYLINWN